MTDQLLPPSAEDDVEGHSVPRMMGLDRLTRPGAPNSRARATGEPVEPELPPLTRRFPRMRDGETRTPER